MQRSKAFGSSRRLSVRPGRSARLEQLEARALLAAPYEFAGVGVYFAATPSVYAATGTYATDGTVTGTLTSAGLSGTPTTGPLTWASFQLLSGGRLLTAPAAGSTPYDREVGANPFDDEGYPIGFDLGSFDAGPASDLTVLIQRAPTERDVDWTGSTPYEFSFLRLTSAGTAAVRGHFSLNPEFTILTWDEGNGAIEKGITSIDHNGTVHLATGEVIFPSSNAFQTHFTDHPIYGPGRTAIIADLDNSDGAVGIGAARNSAEFIQFTDAAGLYGVYRASVVPTGPLSSAFFHAPAGAPAAVVIDLDFRGRYQIYDAALYDQGQRTALAGGSWDVPTYPTVPPRDIRYAIVMHDDVTGDAAYLGLGYDYTVTPQLLVSADGQTTEDFFGVGAAYGGIAVEHFGVQQAASIGPDGRPLLFEFSEADAQWYRLDLTDRAGGAPVSVIRFIQVEYSNPVYMVAGIGTNGDVLVWQTSYTGRWTFRNLTQELKGAAGIVANGAVFDIYAPRNVDSFHGALPALAIAGKGSDGHLVVYTPDLTPDRYGMFSWSFTDITAAYLEPNGRATPDFVGPVTGYGPTWEAVHISGLDSAGQVRVVWTAPGLNTWYENNLSEISGAPALAGPLTAFITSWNAIHIHGLTPDGRVVVTWWAPGFGGLWRTDNLTDQLFGLHPPRLEGSTPDGGLRGLVSFLGLGPSLNVVGYDGAGRIHVYWWREDIGWNIGELTAAVPGSDRPASLTFARTNLQAFATTRYVQDLLGYASGGDTVRLFWDAAQGDVWQVQDLTLAAAPLP